MFPGLMSLHFCCDILGQRLNTRFHDFHFLTSSNIVNYDVRDSMKAKQKCRQYLIIEKSSLVGRKWMALTATFTIYIKS